MSDAQAPNTSSWDPQARPAPAPDVARGFFADLLLFAWENKLWWIVPTLVILLGLGGLIWWAQGTSAAPFFYALF